MFNHFKNDASTPKEGDTTVLETNFKGDIPENINSGEHFTTTNMNEFTLNRNDNDFMKAVTTQTILQSNKNTVLINSKNNSNQITQRRSQFINLESKMEELIGNLINKKSTGNNIENEKLIQITKKYAVYKKILEEYIKIIANDSSELNSKNILNKVFEGYNDAIQSLMMNYTKIYDKLSDYESVTNSTIFLYPFRL